MDTFWGVLTFRILVTPSVLLLVYYLGALGMPLLVMQLLRLARQRAPQLFEAIGALSEAGLPREERWKVVLAFWVVFLLMELAWRMMFEFMLAYFQMREALMSMATG